MHIEEHIIFFKAIYLENIENVVKGGISTAGYMPSTRTPIYLLILDCELGHF